MIDTLRILISLSFVLVLAYWSLRVLLPRLYKGHIGLGGSMRVLDRLSLGMRSYLCIVKVNDKIFLISVSPGNVQYLTELCPEEVGEISDNLPAPSSFNEILKSSRGAAETAWEKVVEHTSLHKEKTWGSSHEKKDHHDF